MWLHVAERVRLEIGSTDKKLTSKEMGFPGSRRVLVFAFLADGGWLVGGEERRK